MTCSCQRILFAMNSIGETWDCIKVDALARKLALVNPYARVSRHKVQLNGQEPTSRVAEALRAASSCDLIIDATCSPAVFNLVSGITVGDKTPLICGEVLGGGLGVS